jgi:hypothetical protein
MTFLLVFLLLAVTAITFPPLSVSAAVSASFTVQLALPVQLTGTLRVVPLVVGRPTVGVPPSGGP